MVFRSVVTTALTFRTSSLVVQAYSLGSGFSLTPSLGSQPQTGIRLKADPGPRVILRERAVDSETRERAKELERLEAEERSLSARRTRLQDRIDFLRGGGGGPVEESAEAIAGLERQEREVSEQRRELHERIELARAELRQG
jgi:hypothetical protein